jgi:hypothetical protein
MHIQQKYDQIVVVNLSSHIDLIKLNILSLAGFFIEATKYHRRGSISGLGACSKLSDESPDLDFTTK